MKKLITIYLIAISLLSYSQNSPDWEFVYGQDSMVETSTELIQTSDGGYVIVGYESIDGGNALLIKTNSQGEQLWVKAFGGSDRDMFLSLKQTSDDGLIISGCTYSFTTGNNDRDMWLIKTDANGNEIWNYTYGLGSASYVELTDDGGYIISGSRLIKVDGDGIEQWSVSESCTEAIQTSDGGYALIRSGLTGPAIELEKRTSDGSFVWNSQFGSDYITVGTSLSQTFDGGFIISATTNQYGAGLLDAWLIKADANGNEEWNVTYGDVFHDQCEDVKQTVDGGYILTGLKQINNNTDDDIWVIKVDANGTIQWDYSYDYPVDNCFFSVIQTSDNGYAATGHRYLDVEQNNSQIILMHFNPDPLTAWFTGNQTTIELGETVNFTDGSLGDATSWSWSFDVGDGTPLESIDQNPSVVYNNEGIFDATLTVNNGTSTLTRTNYITVNEGNPPPTYCSSNGDATNKWISLVELNGQTNSSGSSGTTGYEDYTNVVFNLEEGNTYDISLTPGQNPGKKVPHWWRVWIDYNMDGIFDSGEEAFAADNKKSTVTGTISIPAGISCNTRMRITNTIDGAPSPCDVGQPLCEVEDYTIDIAPPTPQPPVADFTADVTYVVVGSTINFSDLSINNPDTWNWSFDVGTGTPVYSNLQNPSIVYNVAGSYNVTLTSSNTLGSDTETKTDYIIVTEGTPPSQYCEPVNIQHNTYINLKEIIINNISSYTGMGSSGYVYYFDFPTFEFEPGLTYEVSLIPSNTRSRFFWRLWIDIDGDGVFDDSELLLSANNKKGTYNSNITIPVTASATDITRMRISMKEGGSQSGPCDDGFTGEVEDYNVLFVSGNKSTFASNSKSNNITMDIYPNPSGGNFTLETNISEVKEISVYNSHGKLLKSDIMNSPKKIFNFSDLMPGTYFITLKSEYGIKTEKLILR